MRKRSKYRPRRMLLDNMAHVQAGVQRVRTTGEAQLNLRIRNHAALDEVRSGRGDFDHADILVMALNVAQALARLGVGRDWMDEIMAGQHVTAAMCVRGLDGKGYEFTGDELLVIDLAMRVHDAHLRQDRRCRGGNAQDPGQRGNSADRRNGVGRCHMVDR